MGYQSMRDREKNCTKTSCPDKFTYSELSSSLANSIQFFILLYLSLPELIHLYRTQPSTMCVYTIENTKKIRKSCYTRGEKKLCNLFTQLARQYIYIKRKLPPTMPEYRERKKKKWREGEGGRRNPFFDTRFLCYTSSGYVHCIHAKGSGSGGKGGEGQNTKWLNHWLTAENAV